MKQRNRAFWERVVAEAERGEQPRSEVARRHGVSLGTLQGWLYRLRRERAGDVGRGAPRALASVRLLPVELKGQGAPSLWLELRVGAELVLLFEQGTDVGYVRSIADALRSAV